MIKFIVLMVLCGQVSMLHVQPNHSTALSDLQTTADRECLPTWTMPFVKLGKKFYYFGTYFRTNWYKAFEYCRFHGLHLATITSAIENGELLKYLFDLGGQEHYWVSGSDLGSEGNFVWMSTGEAVKYSDWWPGQPDNSKDDKNETENCLCLYNPNNNGLRWNDCLCSGKLYFVCEVHQ